MSSESFDTPVVVVGASGFIGRNVVAELRMREISVVAAARRALPTLDGVHNVSVEDYHELRVPNGAIVIHLAGQANVETANRSGEKHVSAEAVLARTFCDQCPSRIVFGSSGQVYGDNSTSAHAPDESLSGTTIYSKGKLAAERHILDAGGVVARLSNIYGPGMSGSLVSDILDQIPGKGSLRIRDAQPRRDYLWVADAARGLVDMALAKPAGIFNLASGEHYSAGEVAELALSIARQGDRQLQIVQPGNGASVIALDISDTTTAFDWSPRTSLKQGLRILLSEDDREIMHRDA